MDLPFGTVTFLFTDVESSTRMLQAHPRGYSVAIARHHELLAAAVERAGGVVFETVGDAVYAAFSDPVAAVRAAVEGQRGLAAEPWPEIGALRVRMGLHTGPVEVRGAHYFGAPLYRCARIMAAAHGGQIILSNAAAELVGDTDSEIRLRDLGSHRLKDLQRPEHLLQLLHPDLSSEFPPPRSLEGRPNNLPLLRTETVGRAGEVAQLRELVTREGVQLITLVGAGGIGKTRLALAAGAELLDDFPHGVFAVSLGALTESGLVMPTVARALSIPEVSGRDVRESLAEHLRDKRLLLVLDNFEHLLDAATELGDLLSAARGVKAVVTSRSPLRLYGEREFLVSPLSLEATDGDSAAVRLFIERAREIRTDFALTAETAATVATICTLLDGLPLAIELAATRIRSLDPGQLLGRLDQRLSLLTGGARDLPVRQQTLRATIAWSHDLLTPEEQALFRRFAVFTGGTTLEDAEAVLTGEGGGVVLDGLESLVAQSLMRRDGAGRFSMLGAVREFARERLVEAGQEPAAVAAHAGRFAEVACDADRAIRGPEQLKALARLDREQDNIRAALEWSVSPSGDPGTARQLVAAMAWYWSLRSRFSEAPRWLAAAYGPPGPDESQRVWALCLFAFFLSDTADTERARRAATEGLAVAQRLGDLSLQSYATVIGSMVIPEDAIARADLGIELARRVGDPWTLSLALGARAERARAANDDDRALALNLESLAIARRSGDRFNITLVLANSAHLQLRRGDLASASAGLLEALDLYRDLGSQWGMAYVLIGLGGVAAHRGDGEGATTILAAASAWFRQTGLIIQSPDRADFDRYIASSRELLGSERFDQAWTLGSALDLAHAVRYAIERVGRTA